MPQIFQVLRCYKCLVFQVHQVKKSNKWECKLCGEKQSVKRHYGLGTAKDCRVHVQKLNKIRGEIHEQREEITEDSSDEIENTLQVKPNLNSLQPKKSKWSEYVEQAPNIEESTCAEPMYLDDREVVLDLPKKQSRTLGKNIIKTYMKKSSPESIVENKIFSNSAVDVPLEDINSYCVNKLPLHEGNTIHNVNLDCKPSIYKKEETVLLPKKSTLLRTNNNSKWAQFVDTNDNDESDDVCPSSTSELQPNTEGLFSLCDDNDLDGILDI